MTYRILSFSGGGMRGIFQAVVMRQLFAHGVSRDDFDLIAGTSTGSIVAASIACGNSPKELEQLFRDVGPNVFRKRWRWLWRSYVTGGPLYDSEELTDRLVAHFRGRDENGNFRDLRLRDVQRLVITATNVDVFAHDTFSASTHPELRVADAVAASCAAPTYFAPVKPFDATYVDGGLWANDPTFAAVEHALRIGIDFRDIRILAVGNGLAGAAMAARFFRRMRKISKKTIMTLFELMFAAQQTSSASMTQRIVGDDNFLSINASLSRMIELDDWKTAIVDLPGVAEKVATDRRSAILAALAEWRESASQPPAPPLIHAADFIRSNDVLSSPWLYDLNEKMTLTESTFPSDSTRKAWVCDIESERRGTSVPEQMNVCCVLDTLPTPKNAYYIHEVGRGLLSDSEFDEMRKGVKLERLADHYTVRRVAVMRSTDKATVEYERLGASYADGCFDLPFRKPADADVSGFDTVILSLRTYLPPSIGWYTFHTPFNLTEGLKVIFRASRKFVTKRNRIPGISVSELEPIGDLYQVSIEVQRPVMANRSIDFMLRRKRGEDDGEQDA